VKRHLVKSALPGWPPKFVTLCGAEPVKVTFQTRRATCPKCVKIAYENAMRQKP